MLTLCVWKAKCPGTHRLKSECCGVCRPDATCLTLIDRKKTRRFNNHRPEGCYGAHLCLVRIRMAGTGWERYVHRQAQSESICVGTRR